jgi:hypothetical protein
MGRCIGFDPGTAFFQIAEQGDDSNINLKSIRNSFVELQGFGDSGDIEQILKQNNWQYVSDDKCYFVVGEDSVKVAQLFPEIEIRRPMQDGVLNKGENKKMLVIASMIENAIGRAKDDDSVVCFCVSSPVIDSGIDNVFHKSRLEGMIRRLGFETKCIDEAMAIILSERPSIISDEGKEIPYSGMAISWGAGRTNVVLAYRGLQILGMSCNRGGDYIDQKVSEQTDTPISQVISVKEKKLDFNNIQYDNDIIFALDAYYTNMLEYVFKNFAKKFSTVKSQFEAPLPIVMAGGTSMPPGFKDKVAQIINSIDLPFKIKDIIHSKDPRNSVVKGCLVQAIITQKKIKKENIDKMLD